MKKRVQITLTKDEYQHLVALSEYSGCYTLSRTLKRALDSEIKKYESNDTFKNYLEDVRRRNEY
ncbi:hypothetical protein [Streptococcus suis]|uniref:hypothetical protein n=1 Tax=Streptococcus suis TaxID=1307 RepID=UPI0005CB235C|nr:hypothetical protein [Streptococcus suis]MBS8011089.1 hypothetical protein [Streptococcus suis]CZA37262.1 Uncharacterised protein [Streptococcus suis]